MSRKSENVKAWRRRTKERMVAAFGGKCCICGNEFPPELYDFHHVNPDLKEFQLSSARGSIKSWSRLVKELKKCVMVCSNCHRLIEYGYEKVPQDAPKFDTAYEEYKSLWQKPKYAANRCPICKSDEVLWGNTYCSHKCTQIARRKVKDRPPITEIKKLVAEHGWAKTGRMFGVSDNAVRKWIARAKE